MTDLGTFGGVTSSANGINNNGQIVGSYGFSSGIVHAFMYESGSMVDLNSLLPANSGWVLTDALRINDAGQIIGLGTLNGVDSVFELTLAPVPSTIGLLAGGIVMLAWGRRRRHKIS